MPVAFGNLFEPSRSGRAQGVPHSALDASGGLWWADGLLITGSEEPSSCLLGSRLPFQKV